jgi:cytochrome c oxidase cbb3-type subunit 2
MNRTPLRAVLAVAAVYGHFLIFAQFSLVELLRAAGMPLITEKATLAVMAVAGIASGFLTAWRGVSAWKVRTALILAALAAVIAPLASGAAGFIGIALLAGAALGMATVGLSALLPGWCGVAWVGLGTGLGYACCNVPAVFLQAPAGQAWIGAGFALCGAMVLPAMADWRKPATDKVFPLWGAVLVFMALVWLDSAAFFIIQHAGDLKSGTWGEAQLWRNALVHLALACLAGLLLARGGARRLPVMSWALLAAAALMVNQPGTRGIAGWLYPAGVSLYSTALVAWPGWFAGATGVRHAAWRGAWLFAIAGWIGSANGIGMAETLQRVPPSFVAVAGVIVVTVMALTKTKRWREALAVASVLLTAWAGARPAHPEPSSAAGRGRQVYVSEGCIHCHSQYVRPGSSDEKIWGPARSVAQVLEGEPVLIGNRRQGPDLANVGARRSEAWLKAHFIDPSALVPDSPMPSYAHLFDDGRGDDLVRYLRECGIESMPKLIETQASWFPSPDTEARDAKQLYARHCASCHGADGTGGGPLAAQIPMPPPNLRDGPFIRTTDGDATTIARIIKFGVIGSYMPGHETMKDSEVAALTRLLSDTNSHK